MTADRTEENIGDIMVEVAAEYLSRWESRQHVLQDHVGIGMSRTISNAVNLLPRLGEDVSELDPCDGVVVQKGLDEESQNGVIGDGHANG